MAEAGSRTLASEEHRWLDLAAGLPWRRLVADRRLLVGASMLVVVLVAAVGSEILAPYPPYDLRVGPRLAPPDARHFIGTDVYGRDQFSRLLIGARISVQAGAVIALGALAIGLPLGLAAGYRGGWVDEIIGRLLELVLAFPWILVALLLAAVLGPSLTTAVASLVIVYTPLIARLTRSVVLSERERDYVAAARVNGASGWRISARHVAPNIVSPLIVLTTSIMAYAVLAEASLSYLGLGAQPPTASWGRMLTENSTFFASAPHLALFPGIAISWLVLALNLLGDAMRDQLDPHKVRVAR